MKLKNIYFSLTKRSVHINLIEVMLHTKDALVISIDCKEKRSILIDQITTENKYIFYIGSKEDDYQNSTHIELYGWKTGCRVFVESGRYYHTIALLRLKRVKQFVDDDLYKAVKSG